MHKLVSFDPDIVVRPLTIVPCGPLPLYEGSDSTVVIEVTIPVPLICHVLISLELRPVPRPCHFGCFSVQDHFGQRLLWRCWDKELESGIAVEGDVHHHVRYSART